LRRERYGVSAELAFPTKESVQQDEHPIRWIALPYEGLARPKSDLLGVVQKPLNFSVRQV
jgi:hypothetical protein